MQNKPVQGLYSKCKALCSIVELRNVKVQVQSTMKVATQVDREEKSAFGTLAYIGQDMEYRSWNVMP